MLRRENRFHGHHSVSNVRAGSQHSAHLSMRAAKSKRSDFRLAVVVSKKVAPHAVDRNRIRRRIFEIVRVQNRLQNTPLDVVLYAKSTDIATLEHSALQAEVASLTKKALQQL